ncbi:helicase protein MOM1-like isoform X2 [Vicia villosa]|uniref:helicase protein MOM1-like isoform X2 n=1 Tax=Vicia villosa TaxID=3911 RepID=UPI00273BAA7F|nr:helicase protein MOM1-like isoform X2 [Vicia villosa]
MVSSPSSSGNHKKTKSSPSTTPSPLRRSERQRNLSSNSNRSPSTSTATVSKSESRDKDEKTSSNRKKLDARRYRNILAQKKNKDCHKETNDEHALTPQDSNKGESEIDECYKGISLGCKEVFEDCIKPSEDGKAKDTSAKSMSKGLVKEPLENNVTIGSTVVASNSTAQRTSEIPERVNLDSDEEEIRGSDSNGSLIRKCVGNDKGGNLTPSKSKSTEVDIENLTPSKRKSTVVGMDSDVSHTLDADHERLRVNSLETSGPSKRIRGINNVDQPTSKSNDEKSCTKNKEERPQGNNDETEKIRTQQRSLHLSVKPEIAKLCEILLLPDNVKSMVGKFLEYTMNNFMICTEPVSILQAFQLSLCLTAASLLSHKLDSEAALILAKRHLNFSCKKDAVDEISAMLWDLKDNFLLLTGDSNANCSPTVSESSKRVHSNTDTTSDVELTKKDISKISRNIKVNQNRKEQWRKLLHIQQENKRKLEKGIEKKMTDFKNMFHVEWQATLLYAKEKVKLREFKSKYKVREAILKREQEARLKALEAEQLEERQKFRESSNLTSSKELGTSHNAQKILLSNKVSETSCKQATASELSRKEAVGLPSKVRSTDYPENAAPLNSLSSDQISDEGLDGVVSPRPRSSSGPSNGHPAAVSLLNSPSSIQKVSGRVSPAISDGQTPVTGPELSGDAAVGLPSTVRSTGYPENAAALNSSPTDQISDVGLDGVASPTPCIFSSPPDGLPATSSLLNSPSSKQQVPDRVLSPITDGQIPVVVPENNHEEAECQLTDNVEVNESTTSNYQDGVDRTMAENTLSQETSVSRAVDPIEPKKQGPGQPLSAVELPSMVTEPPEQVQQLPSSGFLSSNQDISNLPSAAGGEDQPATNEIFFSSQIPEASAVVQNQAAEQPALNLEVDSHLRQVVPPVSDMVLDSLAPGGVTTQSLDTRNLSTHRIINNHPIQTPVQSASRSFPSLFYDPLSYELERIRKSTKQNLKNHEDMKLQLKCNFEKEIEELRRKYDIQMKEIEVEFQKTSKNYDTQYKTVYVHKILADAMKANSDPRFSGLTQLPRLQNPTHPFPVAGPSCRGPPGTTFQNSHASTGSHAMLPSPIHNTPGNFSGFSARPPHINTSSPNLQAGGGICAPPLHPPPYRSSTSVPTSSLMGEFCAPPPPLHPYRPSISVPASSHSGAMPTPLVPIPPYRTSTSVPASSHSGAMRTPPPPLPPYRPSTSVPASSHSRAMRTSPPPLPPYRPSTSVPASGHSSAIRAPAPHLPPYRPSTSVPASSLSGEIRAPAPHIPPYRPSTSLPPSTSVPASSLGGVPHSMPSHPAPAPASSLLLSQRLPSSMPAVSQIGPHRGHGYESTGGFLTPNVSATDMRMNVNSQSSINLPNTLPHMSDSASLNHSQFSKSSSVPVNSTQEATPSDVVCLSDDD